MKLAFCLYVYFPYGGQQRDMFGLAQLAVSQGHEVTILCGQWRDEKPDNITVVELPWKGRQNYQRNRSFQKALQQYCLEKTFDCLIGFVKMPNLDIYFASDICKKIHYRRSFLWPILRFLPRYHYILKNERQVFEGQCAARRVLALTSEQKQNYQRAYQVQDNVIKMLSPGIDPSFQSVIFNNDRRLALRRKLGLSKDTIILLCVAFKSHTKGVDRALKAVASFPKEQIDKIQLWVVGVEANRRDKGLVKSLGLEQNVRFLGGRKRLIRYYTLADVFLHMARQEAAGMVLLEAMACHLPVITTSVCGYAPYIEAANAGMVLAEPFSQEDFASALQSFLHDPRRLSLWGRNGYQYFNRLQANQKLQEAMMEISVMVESDVFGLSFPGSHYNRC